ATLLDPSHEQRQQYREQCPREPRSHHSGSHAPVHAAREPGRQRQRDERERQRYPPPAGEPRERDVRRGAGQQVPEPEQSLIDGPNIEYTRSGPREQRTDVRKARRIELQLGVARPPAAVPCPRRRAVREHVPDAVELTGVIVESKHCAAKRCSGERDAEAEQQHEREHEASIPPCISRWICFSSGNLLLSVL